jgi:hypothetical protein
MSKNMTRKGLAFGAGLSLVATGFIALPAQATGIDNGSVSLTPNTGTNYAVLLGDDFDLKSNSATAVTGTGKYLKFRVVDPTSAVTTTSGNYSIANTATDLTFAAASAPTPATSLITFGANHKFKVGDVVEIAGVATGVNGTRTVVSVPSATEITVTTAATATITNETVGTVKVAAHTNRAASGTYVVDTKVDTNTANKVLKLDTASTISVSVKVTAWVDDNDNGVIDTTEPRSPEREVRFMNINDVVPTVTLAPVSDKAANLTAYITTVPALNGNQLGQLVGAVFTRQESALEVSVLATWDDDTQIWTATKSLTLTDTGGNLYDSGTNGAWTDLPDPADSNITHASSKIVSKVATFTSATNPHKLRVGDKVDISGATNFTDGLYTVTSVPSASTFTVATTDADAAAITTAGTVSYDIDTHGADTSLFDRAVPGTYTARFAAVPAADIDANQVTARYLDKVGAAVSSGATAKTADSLVVDAVQSATVGKTGDTATSVLTGTKTGIGLNVLVLNDKGNPVAANVPVSVTVNGAPTGAGDYTINGTLVANGSVVFAMTNASGVASFTLGNTSALAGDAISVNVSSQGLTNVAETFTWGGVAYSIVDLNDTTSQASGIRDRAVAVNGTYTFDLLVRDQFKTPANGANFRIKATVTGDTVFTRYVTLNNGRATLAITDEQVSASDAFSSVQLELEELVLGTWSAATDSKVVNWDQAYSNGVAGANDEQSVVRVGNYTGTASIVFNANGASLPSTTAAALTAAVESKEFVEADQRVANVAAPSLTAAAAAKVTGQIRNSVTAVAIKGAPYTISGAGLLFKSGEVWKKDSISGVADANGYFEVQVYSRTSGEKTLSMTSMGVTNTVKVTYTGLTTQAGYSVKITAPDTVQRGSTYRVDGQILDVNGNGIALTTAGTGTNPTLSVTYLGLGLVSGGLPTTTDKDGKFYFYVLVGTNDVGTATITASYDADGTSTTLAAATASKTVYVGQSAPGVAKVNVGSFNGKLVVYAANANGKRISWKVGGRWGSAVAEGNYDVFDRPTPLRGVTVTVQLYIDGKLELTKSVVTR